MIEVAQKANIGLISSGSDSIVLNTGNSPFFGSSTAIPNSIPTGGISTTPNILIMGNTTISNGSSSTVTLNNAAIANLYTNLGIVDINTSNTEVSLKGSNASIYKSFDPDIYNIGGVPFSRKFSSFSFIKCENKKFIIKGNVTIPKSCSSSKPPELELTEDSSLTILAEQTSPISITLHQNAKINFLYENKEFTFTNYNQDKVFLNDIITLTKTAVSSVKLSTKTLSTDYTLEQIKDIVDGFKKTIDTSTYKEILNLFVGQNSRFFHNFNFPKELLKKGYTSLLNFKLTEKSLEESPIFNQLAIELKYHISYFLEDEVNIIGNES